MLKAIHAQEDARAARQNAAEIVEKLTEMKLGRAAEIVAAGVEETISYYSFPSEHWRSLRTNNPMERWMRQIRRRTRNVGAFPDDERALVLLAARLRYVAEPMGTKTIFTHEQTGRSFSHPSCRTSPWRSTADFNDNYAFQRSC